MLAHVVLSPLAWIALAAYELRACRDVVARAAYRDILAYSNYHTRIFVTLHYGIECGRVQTVIGMNLAAADAYTLYIDENLMWLKVFSFWGFHFLEFDVFGGY